MPEKDSDEREWRDLFLFELRELRSEFKTFKEEVIAERGEKKGKQTVISFLVSLAVSIGIGLIGLIRSKT